MSIDAVTYYMTLKKNINMLSTAFSSLVLFYIQLKLFVWYSGVELYFFIDFIQIFVLGFIIFLSPAVYIHLEYLIENINCTLMIDLRDQTVTITRGITSKKYKFEEIILSKVYRSIYFKNDIDDMQRRKTFFSDYGYWVLKFADGNTYFFTSLICDITDIIDLDISKVIYVLFPFIRRKELTELEMEKSKKENYDYGVGRFVEKYGNYSVSDLQEIIENPKSYQIEAVEASKKLIKNRENNIKIKHSN